MNRETLNDRNYVREYFFVLTLGMVFCFFISILTYNPADPTFFSQGASQKLPLPITNTFGPLGAAIADWCVQLFGIGSLVFSMVFIAQILNTFRRPKQQSRILLRAFGYPQLIVCYLALVSGILPTYQYHNITIYTGGAIGHSLFYWLSHFIGAAGAFIAFGIGFFSSLVLSMGIRPLSAIAWILALLPFSRTKKMATSIELLEEDARPT